MKTLQEKYNAVLEGNFPKSQFVRDAKMEVPRFISPYNGFEDTVQILKNKGMLVEAKAETPEYDKPAPGYPLEALERGVDYELEKMGLMSNETVSEEDYAKAKKKAEKNLEKDVNHYLHLLSGDSKKVDKHDREVEVDQKKLFKGTVDPKGGKAEGNTDTFNAMKKATLREAAMAKGYTKEQVETAIKRLQEKKENKVDEAAKETSFSSDEIKSVSFPNGLSVTVGEEHPEEEGIVIGIEKGENGYLIMFQDGSEGGGYHVDFDGEFLDEDDFIEENIEEKIDEGDPIVDEHEFDFFKTFFGIGSKDVYPNTNAEDEEIEAYLKSDDYQEELKHSELDEKDIGAWIDSFLDWRASTGREKVFKQDIKEAVKKVIKHVLKENHQSLDLEVGRRIEGLLDQALKAKFLEAGKDLIEDLVKEDQFAKNDVVSHLANELNLHVPIRDLFKEGTLNERVGSLQEFINLIQDRAAESGFSEAEEAEEVIYALGEHYNLGIDIMHAPNEAKVNENQDAIKFAQFIHAHGLKDKQIKDEEYLKDLYDNYKESVKENTNEGWGMDSDFAKHLEKRGGTPTRKPDPKVLKVSMGPNAKEEQKVIDIARDAIALMDEQPGTSAEDALEAVLDI